MTSTILDRNIAAGAHTETQPSLREPTAFISHAHAVKPDFALFMKSTTKCEACRLLQQAAGSSVNHRVHVRRTGDLLIITDADDLHQPSLPLIAKHAIDFPNIAMFRLVSELPSVLSDKRFRPAVGMVTFGLRDRSWTLTVVGTEVGTTSTHEYNFQAIELKD